MIEPTEISTSTEVLESGQNIAQLAVSNQEDQDKRNQRIKAALINGAIFMGASTAFAGNFLLMKNLIVSTIPASLFMLDAGTGAGVAAARTLMSACNIQSKTANAALVGLTFASMPALPTAVAILNPPPLNPELADVWQYFFGATAALTANHVLTMGEEVAKAYNSQEEPSFIRKVLRNVPHVFGPAALGAISIGMWNMWQHTVEAAKDQKEIDAAEESFLTAIIGMTTIGLALTANTTLQLKKYFSLRNASTVTSEEVQEDEDILVEHDGNEGLEEVVISDQVSPEPVLNPEAEHQSEADVAPNVILI